MFPFLVFFRLDLKITNFKNDKFKNKKVVMKKVTNFVYPSHFFSAFKVIKMISLNNLKNLLPSTNVVISSIRNASKKTSGSTKNPKNPHGR